MKNLFKGLELNEKDNLATAFGKGMVEGTLKSALTMTLIGGAVYLVGKACQTMDEIDDKIQEIEEEVEEIKLNTSEIVGFEALAGADNDGDKVRI